MGKDETISIKLTRKQTAPRNVAAKSLRAGQFRPKVQDDPKAYRRREKHKADPVAKAETDGN